MCKKNILKLFIKDKKGATAIEYGLVTALVAVGTIVAITYLGTANTNLHNNNSEKIGQVINEAIKNTQ